MVQIREDFHQNIQKLTMKFFVLTPSMDMCKQSNVLLKVNLWDKFQDP